MKPPKLGSVDCSRGAPMGRFNIVEEPDAPIKFSLTRMKMTCYGDYDQQGAYWGCGSPTYGWMYRAWGEGPEYVNEMFIRAVDRAQAKAAVLQVFKNARFYR